MRLETPPFPTVDEIQHMGIGVDIDLWALIAMGWRKWEWEPPFDEYDGRFELVSTDRIRILERMLDDSYTEQGFESWEHGFSVDELSGVAWDSGNSKFDIYDVDYIPRVSISPSLAYWARQQMRATCNLEIDVTQHSWDSFEIALRNQGQSEKLITATGFSEMRATAQAILLAYHAKIFDRSAQFWETASGIY